MSIPITHSVFLLDHSHYTRHYLMFATRGDCSHFVSGILSQTHTHTHRTKIVVYGTRHWRDQLQSTPLAKWQFNEMVQAWSLLPSLLKFCFHSRPGTHCLVWVYLFGSSRGVLHPRSCLYFSWIIFFSLVLSFSCKQFGVCIIGEANKLGNWCPGSFQLPNRSNLYLPA